MSEVRSLSPGIQGLIERLENVPADTGWAVWNTKTDGVVIWFSDRDQWHTEHKARKWLAEHADTHRTHEVRPYSSPCLSHEAATTIRRLLAERDALAAKLAEPSEYEFVLTELPRDKNGDAVCAASGTADNIDDVVREGNHYAAMYSQDGPVELEFFAIHRVKVDAAIASTPAAGE